MATLELKTMTAYGVLGEGLFAPEHVAELHMSSQNK